MDDLVLVKRVRPRVEGRYAVDGGWKLDVQRAAQEDALKEWAQKPVAPFAVVPVAQVESWSIAPLYGLFRSLIP